MASHSVQLSALPKLCPRAEESKFQGKEELNMRYTKPTIVSLGAASNAIQGFGHKTLPNMIDAVHPLEARTTGSAYDLDE
jgi:hypothetical protein